MPDQNSRFRTSLWDIYGYMQEVWLDRISDTQYVREVNNEHNYTFQIPMRDLYYPLIKHRKIVRLHDMSMDSISNTVYTASSSTNILTLATSSQFKIGDYVIIYEHEPNKFIGKMSSSVTSGTDKTISYTTDDSNYAFGGLGSYVKIIEQLDTERLDSDSGEYVRSPNMEVVEVITSTTGTDSGSFTADLSYDFSSDAIIVQPGRSFVAKILTVNGLYLGLSRMDFVPATNALVQKVNFTSFRIREINESRDSGNAISNITCDHITLDLNDTLFFKDTRTDISYASKGSGQIIQDRVDINTMLDNILSRHLQSGKPVSTKSFIKGDFYRHKYNKGTISRNGSNNKRLDGDVLAGFNDSSNTDGQSISPGSKLYIEGDNTIFTIKDNHSTGEGGWLVDQNVVSDLQNANYMILSAGAYTEPSDKVGTCNVSNGNDYADNLSFTVTGGLVSHGAVFTVDEDTNIYFVDYVTSTGTVYLDKEIERASGTGVKCSIKRDERELNTSNINTSMGVLNNLMEVFTDDQQVFFYNINEDRSIDIIRKPLPDGRDPTSDLVVQYRDNQIRNLKSISREFEISEFGNRIIPQGSTSGWVNCESGVMVPIAESIIKGTATGSLTAIMLEDSGGKFLSKGVSVGMKITNDPNNLANLKQSVLTSVTNTQLKWEYLGADTLNIGNGEDYKIYTGQGKSELRLKSLYNKHFRFGDPIHIFNDKNEFTVSELSQISVSNAITGTSTDATVETLSVSTMVDENTNFYNIGITQGMFISKAGEKSPTGIITDVLNDTITFVSIFSPNGLDFTVFPKDYRISKSSQINLTYDEDEASGSRYFDETENAIVDTGTLRLFPDDIGGIQTVNNACYFGSNNKFGYITIRLSASMGSIWDDTIYGGTMVWEYFNGSAAAPSWSTLDFTQQSLVTGGESVGTLTNDFSPPTDWSKLSVPNLPNFNGDFTFNGSDDDFYWVRMRVSSANSQSVTAPQVNGKNGISNREWRENGYAGGLLKIEDGTSKGVIRRIMANTTDTLTINRKFDDPSTIKGALASVTKEVGNTFVKGFGYRILTVDSATHESITFDSVLEPHAYFGGILTVKSGSGKGQVYRISGNSLVLDYDNRATSQFFIELEGSGSFTHDESSNATSAAIVVRSLYPIPKKGDQIEIVGNPLVYFEQVDDVTYSRDTSDLGRITFTTDNTGWITDCWAGGRAYIVSGDSVQEGIIYGNDGNSVLLDSTFGSSGTFSGTPATGSKAILIKQTGLHISLAEGLEFIAGNNSDISLLLKESGGPLTIGKHYSQRAIASGSTTTNISLGGYMKSNAVFINEADKFSKNDIIFVGAKRIASSVYSNIGIGDQVQGQQAVVKKVISLSGEISGLSVGSEPKFTLRLRSATHGEGEPFLVDSGVTAGMFIRVHREGSSMAVESGDDRVLGQYLDYMVCKINPGTITGTCDVDYNSNVVQNVSADPSDIHVGAEFTVDGDSTVYTVDSVTSTEINLSENIDRSSADGLNFVVKQEDEIEVVKRLTWDDGVQLSYIDDTHYFTIDCLELVGTLDPVSITGDHVERVGFVHESSARKNDIIEVVQNDTSTSDPKILFQNADRKLKTINEIEPRYSVSFIDLFEYDKDSYPYDSYNIGDTIRIIDEDITGPAGSNLRVLKESFSPELPADKTHTMEVGKRRRSFFKDDYAKVKRDINTLKHDLKEAELNYNIPTCMWWDNATKSCTRIDPPNYFCESDESNMDGRMTREKIQITRLHCQSYSPNTKVTTLGGQTTITDSVSYMGILVNSEDYPTSLSSMQPIDVDFILNKTRTKVHILDVVLASSGSAAVNPSGIDIELELDSYGNVVPYNTLGHGGYFKLRKGSEANNVLVSVIAVPVGYDR